MAVHNLEEALLLPAWSQRGGWWRYPVGAQEFGFAVIVLTAAAAATALLANFGGKTATGACVVCGYALAMLLNVLFPHLLATLVLCEYTPDTFIAIFLNLPACTLLLGYSLREQYVEVRTFLWVGPSTVLAIVAAIPLLFAAGRKLTGSCATGVRGVTGKNQNEPHVN